jgi:hypothetical protein
MKKAERSYFEIQTVCCTSCAIKIDYASTPSQFVTGKILTKILMFGKAVVKIPSLEFSKVEMFVTDLSDSEDKMSLNCKNSSRTDASRSLE